MRSLQKMKDIVSNRTYHSLSYVSDFYQEPRMVLSKLGTHLLRIPLLLMLVLLSFNHSVWGQEVRYYRVPTEVEPAEHDHWVVSVGGIPVIIIRGRAGFTDVESRARHTEEHLEEAFTELRTTLSKSQRPVAGFAIEDCARNPCIYLMGTEIIQVTSVDAVAYERRDAYRHQRQINKRVVAEYWRGLLQDIALLLNGQEPSTLGEYDEARILVDIYGKVREKMGTADTGRVVSEVISSLDSEQRRSLEQLVFRIPRRFHTPAQIPPIQPRSVRVEVPEVPIKDKGEDEKNDKIVPFLLILLLLAGVGFVGYKAYRMIGARSDTKAKTLSFSLEIDEGWAVGERSGYIELPPGGRLYLGGDHEIVFRLQCDGFLQNDRGNLMLYEQEGSKGRVLENGEVFELETDQGNLKVRVVRLIAK